MDAINPLFNQLKGPLTLKFGNANEGRHSWRDFLISKCPRARLHLTPRTRFIHCKLFPSNYCKKLYNTLSIITVPEKKLDSTLITLVAENIGGKGEAGGPNAEELGPLG